MTEYELPKRLGFILAIVFILSVFTCLFIGKSLIIGLSITLGFAVLSVRAKGVPFRTSLTWIVRGIWSIKDIYMIVLLVGVNVAMWISSGIVPAMIYYGFNVVDKVYFLLFAYLMTALVAFFLGTGLGTLSTIGVALFSLGISIGMPPGILVGALISGAYVADRLSPISALVNFTLETVDVKFNAYFKSTSKVMIPAAILAGFVYLMLSLKYKSNISVDSIIAYKAIIVTNFMVSPLLFIVPFFVLIASFKGIRSARVLGTGIFFAALITIFVQGNNVLDTVSYMLNGFKSGGEEGFLKSLEIGGAFAMVEVVLIIMAGISMSTLYEKCGWINPIINLVSSHSTNRKNALVNTGILSTVLNALTCDQTVGILVPGRYLKPFFKKFNYDDVTLAQIIANTGTALAPLMPWNVNAIIILAITGVSAMQYAPFAFLNWFTFPAAIILTSGSFQTYKNIKSNPIK